MALFFTLITFIVHFVCSVIIHSISSYFGYFQQGQLIMVYFMLLYFKQTYTFIDTYIKLSLIDKDNNNQF